MPDQTVRVTFSPPDTWTFVPREVTLTAAGKVQLHRDPGNARWRFVGAEVEGGRQFAVRVNPNGNLVTVTDRYDTLGSFPYTVTVELDGQEYSSAPRATFGGGPPVIRNEPE